MKRSVKVTLNTILALFLAVLLVVISYVIYVFVDYSRIDDNLALSPTKKGDNAVKTGVTYTAVSYNVGFGAYEQDFTFFMDGGKESRARSEESVYKCIGGAKDLAKSYDPDFVFLQEVDTDSTRSHHIDQAEYFKNAFPDLSSVFAVNYHSAYLFWPLLEPHGASNSGLLTLSKTGITSAVRRQLPISTSVTKIVDLDRCYSVSRVPVENGKELVLINVHLSAYGGSDEIRAAQMGMLFDEIQSEYDKGNYVICGGDYNHDFTGNSTLLLNGDEKNDFGWAQPFPEDLLKQHSGFHRAIDYTVGKQLPTCRDCDIPYVVGNKVFIVDGFLVSDNVSVSYLENVQTDFVYSDHNPVVISFSLN